VTQICGVLVQLDTITYVKFEGRNSRLHEKTFLLDYECTLQRDVFLLVCRVACANVVGATSGEGLLVATKPTVIVESSLWKDEESVSQGQGQTARSRDCRVPCRCSTPSVPLISSSSSSSMPSSLSCECLAACHPTLTAASLSATSASESTSLFGVEPTSILPFLFLGSQRDALSSDVINVSSLFDRLLHC